MNLLTKLKELEKASTPEPWEIDCYPKYFNSADKELIQKMRNSLPKLLAVCEAAKLAAKEIDIFYQKHTQESHIQTIYEEDHSLWFARDEIDAALKALEEE